MRRALPRVVFALVVSTFQFTTSLLAQLPDPPIRPGPSTLRVRPAVMSGGIPAGFAAEDKVDHTVLGLIVGVGLGFAAGWAFYNTMCEAVDNQCSDSRGPYLVFGTAIGGGLGALIGSLAD